jgi:hypothetical protein
LQRADGELALRSLAAKGAHLTTVAAIVSA